MAIPEIGLSSMRPLSLSFILTSHYQMIRRSSTLFQGSRIKLCPCARESLLLVVIMRQYSRLSLIDIKMLDPLLATTLTISSILRQLKKNPRLSITTSLISLVHQWRR
uniref:Uncharacterized protein n=1 Tax=Cacopsylla melanoneura TaxID=428564 RepID=A0A8D8SDL4_9HEMI